jgi:hypothetical protein
MYFAFGGIAAAHLALRRFDEALVWAEKGRQQYRGWSTGLRILITCLVVTGRLEDARRLAADYVLAFPGFRVSPWAARAPINHPKLVEEWAESYRRAGLPE